MSSLLEVDPFTLFMAPLFALVTIGVFLEPLLAPAGERRGPRPGPMPTIEEALPERRAA